MRPLKETDQAGTDGEHLMVTMVTIMSPSFTPTVRIYHPPSPLPLKVRYGTRRIFGRVHRAGCIAVFFGDAMSSGAASLDGVSIDDPMCLLCHLVQN